MSMSYVTDPSWLIDHLASTSQCKSLDGDDKSYTASPNHDGRDEPGLHDDSLHPGFASNARLSNTNINSILLRKTL